MTIIGIDPGGKTGIVVGYWGGGRFNEDFVCERKFESVGREFVWYMDLFTRWRVDIVYCETFSLRTAVTSEDVTSPIVVRTVVGCALEGVRGGLGVVPLGGVSPSMAKSTVTDARLKRWGYWHVGSSHVRDAYRQILVHKGR